jgi:outer membrane protein assembly factor BamB
MPDGSPDDATDDRPRVDSGGRAAWALTVYGAWLIAGAGVLTATGRIDDARPVAVLAGVGLLLGALACQAVRRRCIWLLAAVVVAGTVAELWYVAGRLPPRLFHPATYPLLVPAWSLCLAVVGVALAVVGRLMGADRERGQDRDRFRVGVRVSGPALAAALAVLTGFVLVPWHVLAANTVASTSDAPLPRPRPPALTGHVAWEAADVVTDSAAGPVVVTGDTIGVLDPSTGRLRWQYKRWDETYTSVLDGTPVVASADGRSLVAQPESDESDPGLEVFDARTGRLRRQVPVGEGRLLAITARQQVLLASESSSSTLTAYALDGDRAWTAHLDASCESGSVVEQDRRRAVLDACGSLFALDIRTGRQIWHRDPPRGQVLDALVAPEGATRLLVRIRPSGERRGLPTGFVVLDAATGRVAWRVSGTGHARRLTSCNSSAVSRDVVVSLCRDGGRGRPDRGVVTAYQARTGKVIWHRSVTRPVLDDEELDSTLPLAALPDGRVVIGYGPYSSGDRPCSLTVVDRDGRRAGGIRIEPHRHFCPARLVPMRGLLLGAQQEPYGTVTAFD